MLQATFWPPAVSSMPQTRSGEVSKRTGISAEKVSLRAVWMAARCSFGRSKALFTSPEAEPARKAWASSSFGLLSSSPRRRMNTSTTRASRLTSARSASVFFAMANTSCWVRRRRASFRVWASFFRVSWRFPLKASAAVRAASSSRWCSAAASAVALPRSAARCRSKSSFRCWKASRSAWAAACFPSASARAAAMRFSLASMAWRMGW